MYERHKRRYSLCDISKVDRTVDVVLLKVRGHTSQSPQLSVPFSSHLVTEYLVAPSREEG